TSQPTYSYYYSLQTTKTEKKCSEGYVCVSSYYKAYRNGNCEIVSTTYVYCPYGCKDGVCQYPRYTIPSGKGQYWDCDNDGDCPAGYYCKHTFTYDRCVPIWGDP
ncbi:MAG: hypothetical protein QXM75_02785, partial [Candidatus Diapherotrites archaeon]